MTSQSRIHPTPERLAAFARGKLDAPAAAAVRRHLDTCPSCRTAFSCQIGVRSAEGHMGPFGLAAESPADAAPAEPHRPHKKSSAGRLRKRRREPARHGWLVGSLLAATLLLLVAVGVMSLILFRRNTVPAEQAKAPSSPLEPAPAPSEKPVEPAKPGLPSPASAVAGVPPAPQPPPPPAAPLLTDEEKRWQQTFRIRLAQFGRARCGTGKLQEKALAGVLLDLEALAMATHIPLNATTVTVLDKDSRQLPATTLFFAGLRPQVAHLTAGASVTTIPGEVHIGKQQFRFAPGSGLADMLILLGEGPSLEYDFDARRTYRIGFLFNSEPDQLTVVRLLGHLLPLEPSRRDDATPPVALAPPARPEPRPAEPRPAEPPDTKLDAPGEPEVYHHVPRIDVTSTSKNIWVRQDGRDSWKVGAVGASGEVAAEANGADVKLVPDALGSTGLLVRIGRLGYTTLAGLRFYQMARLNIWEDGTVEVDQPGVRAKDEDGDNYVSRRMTLLKRTAIVMVKLPPQKPSEAPKSIELTEAERNERNAANKLAAARGLLEDGKRDRARTLCEEILKTYPQTRAAPEAKKLLGD